MTAEKIEAVEAAIARFLLYTEGSKDHIRRHSIWPNKDRASLRRASLDLTRALADMRRP